MKQAFKKDLSKALLDVICENRYALIEQKPLGAPEVLAVGMDPIELEKVGRGTLYRIDD